MDSSQVEGTDFISDVCQLVRHFFYDMKFKMAAKNMAFRQQRQNYCTTVV